MVGSLADGGRRADDACPPGPTFARRRKTQVQRLAAATVKILARASDSTISVSWLDATACRYDDQIWRIGVAIVVPLDVPGKPAMRTVSNPIQIMGEQKVKPCAAPQLGEHGAEILKEMDFNESEIARLHDAGVVARFEDSV
jgi:crotonobetainyl-CoA:carnitine CoA-transferase CaiB-like acyl-CoA transferase